MRSGLALPLRALLALVTSAALATACAGRMWPSSVGVRKGVWDENGPTGNWARSSRNRVEEWPFNHRDRQTGEPGLCLALSGGGLRSASFSIGVLSGLHAQRILREIDRASSVSGGGYALSWYLAHHFDAWNGVETGYDATALEDALFDPDGLYQKQLESEMDILTNPLATGRFGSSTAQALAALILTVPMAGVNLFANGLFGWHANVSPMQWFYQARIERVFHLTPGGWSFDLYGLGRDQRIGGKDLRTLLRRTKAEPGSHLPFPIFVTAANLNHTSGSAALHVASRLFEFTPWWIGSDAFGYYKERPFDLHTTVAVSAAALDSRVALSGPPSLLASILNMDLGYHIDNPSFEGNQALYMLQPIPIYFWGGWQNDLDGARIHLTDGGHAENLGAYPLFRRLCRQTLIVDGTYDPNLGFDDYRVLRESLRAELELKLEVPAIDTWVELQLAFSQVLLAIRKADRSDIDRGRRMIEALHRLWPAWDPEIGRPYEQSDLTEALGPDGETKMWKLALESVESAIRARLETLAEEGAHVPGFDELTPDMAWLLLAPKSDADEPWAPVLAGEVLPGVVKGLEHPVAGAAEEKPGPLEVFYLKLSLPRADRLAPPDRCDAKRWGDDVCKYRKEEPAFPQEKTEDLSFEPLQYRAYRELGMEMGKRFRLCGTVSDGWWGTPGNDWRRRPVTTGVCPGE